SVRKRLHCSAGTAMMICEFYGTGLASLFASQAVAGCALRRQVLHCCAHQSSLLSVDLSCAHSERKKCTLLPQRRSCCGSWLSPVLALPAGMLARNSGLVRNLKYSLESFAVDQ